MNKDQSEPQGEMILRTLAMPADTNPNGDIFGGWVMAQMDIAGGILSKEVAQGRTVTIAVEGMKFIKPVHVGDVVCCYGLVDSIGNTSVALKLEVWVRPVLQGDGEERFKVTQGRFVYVAIDDSHNKRSIPKRISAP